MRRNCVRSMLDFFRSVDTSFDGVISKGEMSYALDTLGLNLYRRIIQHLRTRQLHARQCIACLRGTVFGDVLHSQMDFRCDGQMRCTYLVDSSAILSTCLNEGLFLRKKVLSTCLNEGLDVTEV